MLISYNVTDEELRIVDMKRLRSITIHRAYYSTGRVNRSASNTSNELVIPDSLFEETFDILKTYNKSLLRNQIKELDVEKQAEKVLWKKA